MKIHIRPARPDDLAVVLEVLHEAADWLIAQDMRLWLDEELQPQDIAQHIEEQRYFIAEYDNQTVGVFRFELADPEFWPELTEDNSAFMHRLAIRRAFAGGELTSAIFAWAIAQARHLDREYLRLDCEAHRPKLRAVYERLGFRHHSDKQVDTLLVSRYELNLMMPITPA